MSFNVIIAGVGSMGVPELHRVLSRSAWLAGHKDVCGYVKSGIVERYGSVYATLRVDGCRTPYVAQGEADILLGLEPVETLRAACGDGRVPRFASPQRTRVFTVLEPVIPLAVTLGEAKYPDMEDILSALETICLSVTGVEPPDELASDPDSRNFFLLGRAAESLKPVCAVIEIKESITELFGKHRAKKLLESFDAGKYCAPEFQQPMTSTL